MREVGVNPLRGLFYAQTDRDIAALMLPYLRVFLYPSALFFAP
jgi:hypothetical protein